MAPSIEDYIYPDKTQAANPESANAADLAGEFFRAGYDAAVVNKARGVAQLFGAHIAPRPQVERDPLAEVVHVAGTATGEILDFVILSKLAGAGLKSAGSRLGSKWATALGEKTAAHHAINGGAVGLFNGAVLTEIKDHESHWNRLGHGITEAGTFATLGGLSTRFGASSNSLLSRLKNNGAAGAAAGVVHAQLDGFTHGRLASLEATATAGAGWAVGNIAFGEAVLGLQSGARATRKALYGEPRYAEVLPVRAETNLREQKLAVENTPTERQRTALDAPQVQPVLEPSETLSMRELVKRDPAEFEQLLPKYHDRLHESFPLEGEIESVATYRDYLSNPGTWDMVVLRDKNKDIIGGIQYQIIDVNGSGIKKAAWGEHIWLAPEARNYPNFRGLINVAKDRIEKAGGELVFMEFNNPDKMTPLQIQIDAEAGISPADREKVWGRVGIHTPVDSTGNLPEYGQPSMDGQPAVDFLSLGFIGPKPLTGKTITKGDYLKLARAAHATIPGLDVSSDPTIKFYTESVQAMKDDTFTFIPLAALARARESALHARTQSFQDSISRALTQNLTPELQSALLTAAKKQAQATPDAVHNLLPGALHNALDAAIKQAQK